MKPTRKGHSITFRGKAARKAFEAITGTKLPEPADTRSDLNQNLRDLAEKREKEAKSAL